MLYKFSAEEGSEKKVYPWYTLKRANYSKMLTVDISAKSLRKLFHCKSKSNRLPVHFRHVCGFMLAFLILEML
jgi:hypothetical protein